MYAIRSYYAVDLVSLLRETDGLDPRYAQHFEELEGAARRSLNMIDGYVRLQALESGKSAIRASRVDMDELASRITSYNVCYTKLLRPGRPAEQAGKNNSCAQSIKCMII